MVAAKIYSTVFGIVMLFGATLPTSHAGEAASYRLEFDNTWSSLTHPGAFPNAAHFSWVGGGTHNDQVSLWTVGEVASPAMVEMAETGVTAQLTQQMKEAIPSGVAFSVIDQRHWFCPKLVDAPSCGPLSFEVDVDSDFPLLTAVTMLGPSPDWFVGVNGLPLMSDTGWIDQVEVDLFPYDGGTRSDNVFELGGPEDNPPEPITLITTASGQVITNQSLGTLSISRVVACDLDGDYLCSNADIDLLSEAIRTNESGFDLDGDGATDSGDRRYWVEQLMKTHFGDSNLDGSVDFGDFLALSENFGQAAGWAGGDFDGSGTTDFDDFLNLALNFDAGDINVAAVPEPTGQELAIVLVIGWLVVLSGRQMSVQTSAWPNCVIE